MNNSSWHPSASIETLKARARLVRQIQRFFDERGFLEVDTPLMCSSTGTDPNIESISVLFHRFGDRHPTPYYLQSSPEFAMKRLLAAGSGPIYQICKAFRNGEVGRYHNPEFTMLEWYRPGWDDHALMEEVADLLKLILGCERVEKLTYREIFQHFFNLDPFHASIEDLQDLVRQNNLEAELSLSRDGWLQLVMSHFIEPQLGQTIPTFIYDFPASQAALARIKPENNLLAARFEVYVKGIELANGFHELLDADEQRTRFLQDLENRKTQNQPITPLDELFLSALKAGLPDCSGVALGVDRLIMLTLNQPSIDQVLSFDFLRS